MTNPGNIVRVRSRNKGHASVYETNLWAQKWSQGLFSGSGVQQNTSPDMNVLVGGTPSKPDVIIGQNPSGYKIALDIVGQQALLITAPASNSRISSIVAYTDDLQLQSTDLTTSGSPSSCGLIVVNGISAASPSPPTDSQIRAAITADGATGSQAIYGIIASIPVTSTTTTITSTLIELIRATIGYEANSTPTAFGAYQSASVSVSVGTFTKLLFQTEEFDDGNCYDNATSRFTANVAGIHSFNAAGAIPGFVDTNSMFVTLYKNGVELKRGARPFTSTAGTLASVVSATVKLAAGDYIEAFIWQSSGGAKSTTSNYQETWFNGHRVR